VSHTGKPDTVGQKVRIAQLRLDGGTQPRALTSDEMVDDYAEAMRVGTKFPLVVVFFDGTDYWLADGFHRVLAAKKLGYTKIDAEIHQGTQRDAVLFSCGVNADHGLRRTNADKRRAVFKLLRDGEWGQWSSQEIARRCAVSSQFVGDLRRELRGESSAASINGLEIEPPAVRMAERGATTYTMRTQNIGRRPSNGAVSTPTVAAPAANLVPMLLTEAERLLRKAAHESPKEAQRKALLTIADKVAAIAEEE